MFLVQLGKAAPQQVGELHPFPRTRFEWLKNLPGRIALRSFSHFADGKNEVPKWNSFPTVLKSMSEAGLLIPESELCSHTDFSLSS